MCPSTSCLLAFKLSAAGTSSAGWFVSLLLSLPAYLELVAVEVVGIDLWLYLWLRSHWPFDTWAIRCERLLLCFRASSVRNTLSELLCIFSVVPVLVRNSVIMSESTGINTRSSWFQLSYRFAFLPCCIPSHDSLKSRDAVIRRLGYCSVTKLNRTKGTAVCNVGVSRQLRHVKQCHKAHTVGIIHAAASTYDR